MKIRMLLFLLVAMFGCAEENDPMGTHVLPVDLVGIWVDKNTSTDTLEFIKLEDGSSLMSLNRGRVSSQGHDLPKIGSGLYMFELKNNAITLQYSLSSNWNPTDFFFQYNPLQLKIGRFFESENPASILTFRKVKKSGL